MNIRKHIFIVRVVKHLSRLLREVLNSPSLGIPKAHLALFLGSWLRVALPGQGLDWTDLLRSCPAKSLRWMAVTREGMLSSQITTPAKYLRYDTIQSNQLIHIRSIAPELVAISQQMRRKKFKCLVSVNFCQFPCGSEEKPSGPHEEAAVPEGTHKAGRSGREPPAGWAAGSVPSGRAVPSGPAPPQAPAPPRTALPAPLPAGAPHTLLQEEAPLSSPLCSAPLRFSPLLSLLPAVPAAPPPARDPLPPVREREEKEEEEGPCGAGRTVAAGESRREEREPACCAVLCRVPPQPPGRALPALPMPVWCCRCSLAGPFR